MTHVLRIDSSARTEGSSSRTLIDKIIARFTSAGASVTTRDVSTGLPVLTQDWVAANFTPAEARSDAQKQELSLSDKLIDEVKAADVLVIGLPIYNFGMPAALKLWVDLICRAGLTFRYRDNGPEGLLSGKRAIVVLSSGGVELGASVDHASSHLRTVLGFIGVTDVSFVRADGQALDAAAALARADADIATLDVAA